MDRTMSGYEVVAWVMVLIAFGLLWARGEKLEALKAQQENFFCIPNPMKAD